MSTEYGGGLDSSMMGGPPSPQWAWNTQEQRRALARQEEAQLRAKLDGAWAQAAHDVAVIERILDGGPQDSVDDNYLKAMAWMVRKEIHYRAKYGGTSRVEAIIQEVN